MTRWAAISTSYSVTAIDHILVVFWHVQSSGTCVSFSVVELFSCVLGAINVAAHRPARKQNGWVLVWVSTVDPFEWGISVAFGRRRESETERETKRRNDSEIELKLEASDDKPQMKRTREIYKRGRGGRTQRQGVKPKKMRTGSMHGGRGGGSGEEEKEGVIDPCERIKLVSLTWRIGQCPLLPSERSVCGGGKREKSGGLKRSQGKREKLRSPRHGYVRECIIMASEIRVRGEEGKFRETGKGQGSEER